MNDVQSNEPPISIAACVFVNMANNSNVKLTKPKEVPYYYLNIIDAHEGDLCLVYTSNEEGGAFALCKIVRLIDKKESLILNRVTKPLLAVVHYDQDLLSTATERLEQFREQTTDARVNQKIEQDMGKAAPVGYPLMLGASVQSFAPIDGWTWNKMNVRERKAYLKHLKEGGVLPAEIADEAIEDM